jgi:hypothetical protein
MGSFLAVKLTLAVCSTLLLEGPGNAALHADASPAFDRKRLICTLIHEFGAGRRPVTVRGDIS